MNTLSSKTLFLIFLTIFACAKSPSGPDENPLNTNIEGLIAFESEHGGFGIEYFEVFIMNDDGSMQTRMTNNSVYDGQPSISPYVTHIVFTSTRDGNYDIYKMNFDGTNVFRLTSHASWDFSPKWSPDGTKIVFCSFRTGNGDIYIMNSNGDSLQALTTDPATDGGPAWSPNGDMIAFYSDRDGNRNVYIMNSDGSNIEKITDNQFENYQIDWSPDGQQLAFVTDYFSNGNNYDICTIDTNRTNLRRLTSHWGHDEFPEWSPDGSRIAFGSSIIAADEIHVLHIDSNYVERLTNSPGLDYPNDWISTEISNISNNKNVISNEFVLHNNYPNPFNMSTTISFELNKQSLIDLKIYDTNSRLIRNLLNQQHPIGIYKVVWDGKDNFGNIVSSGIYYYKIKSEYFSDFQRMLLIK